MADKMTKREKYEAIKALIVDIPEAQEYVEFIDKELAAHDARLEKERAKRAEKNEAGNALLEAVYEYIANADEPVRPQTIADALAGEFEDVTKNKVTYRAGQLIKDGRIYKIAVKDEAGHKAVAYTADAPEEE